MKRTALVLCIILSLSLPLIAASPKTYQVTGPILELKPDVIVVQKGSEKWEIGRDAATKVTGELKVGAKVTIEYRMSAATITVSDAKPAAKKK